MGSVILAHRRFLVIVTHAFPTVIPAHYYLLTVLLLFFIIFSKTQSKNRINALYRYGGYYVHKY